MTVSLRDACPECGAQHFKKNGHIHNGKQNHQCKECGRQFVLDATKRVIVEEQRTVVQRLLREKISLHGICRAMGVSIRWLMDFMVACFAAVPEHMPLQPVASPRDVIRKSEDQQALGLDRHGQADAPDHRVSCRRSQP